MNTGSLAGRKLFGGAACCVPLRSHGRPLSALESSSGRARWALLASAPVPLCDVRMFYADFRGARLCKSMALRCETRWGSPPSEYFNPNLNIRLDFEQDGTLQAHAPGTVPVFFEIRCARGLSFQKWLLISRIRRYSMFRSGLPTHPPTTDRSAGFPPEINMALITLQSIGQ